MEVENGYIRLYLKGSYYWRDSFLTSMIMGESVATNKKRSDFLNSSPSFQVAIDEAILFAVVHDEDQVHPPSSENLPLSPNTWERSTHVQQNSVLDF